MSITFAGDTLGTRERQTIITSLRNALQTRRIDLDLDENAAAAAGYGFLVTVYIEQQPARPPANTVLLQAEVTVAFSRGGRLVSQTSTYHITETTETLIARRIAEQLSGDQEFFNRVSAGIQ